MVKVVCKQCLKYYCPLQIRKHLIENKRDITKKKKDLSDKIITSVEKQDESLQIVKRHNAEAKTSWANAVKMGLKISCTKTLEIEEKDRSIMFNHPESTKTNSVERKKDDIEFVHMFINQGLQI